MPHVQFCVTYTSHMNTNRFQISQKCVQLIGMSFAWVWRRVKMSSPEKLRIFGQLASSILASQNFKTSGAQISFFCRQDRQNGRHVGNGSTDNESTSPPPVSCAISVKKKKKKKWDVAFPSYKIQVHNLYCIQNLLCDPVRKKLKVFINCLIENMFFYTKMTQINVIMYKSLTYESQTTQLVPRICHVTTAHQKSQRKEIHLLCKEIKKSSRFLIMYISHNC